MKQILTYVFTLVCISVNAQIQKDTIQTYKKRVLETVEVDFLSSYYTQEGDNASVSGGIGTEALTDATGTIIVAIPLNDDDILTVDAGVSAYSSASSSNVGPFDGQQAADPFVASSGASSSDVWSSVSVGFAHSSDDRNKLWSVNTSIASEYDYFSVGFGGSYTRLFNEKNTELSLNVSVFLDTWTAIYPTELRPFYGGNGINNTLFANNAVTGNTNYNPQFTPFNNVQRNSYAFGINLSQILHKNIQGSLSLDLVRQDGLLSTPFQRVYFKDIADSFIENFHLADAIEQLPNERFKVAIGGRLNWYINQNITVRTFYRYYFDDWGINSNTVSIELPLKLSDKFTFYPSFRFYNQSSADYFSPYNEALSTDDYYTSDYDLSNYSANQIGFGCSYTDIFTKAHLWKFGLKAIDLKLYKYDRNTTFGFNIITAGVKFVMDN